MHTCFRDNLFVFFYLIGCLGLSCLLVLPLFPSLTGRYPRSQSLNLFSAYTHSQMIAPIIMTLNTNFVQMIPASSSSPIFWVPGLCTAANLISVLSFLTDIHLNLAFLSILQSYCPSYHSWNFPIKFSLWVFVLGCVLPAVFFSHISRWLVLASSGSLLTCLLSESFPAFCIHSSTPLCFSS